MFNIAVNTFKEIVRNKFLYLILVFACLFILFSIVLGKLTIGEMNKVITDFWVSMIEIFGLIGVLFVGSQLLFKEIEGKTIFLILSKPIQRYEFIVGKFLGFSGVIALIVLFQSVVYLWVLAEKNIPIEGVILMSLVFIFLKLMILLAIVLFFSTFMSNILTILVAIMVYFIAHSFSLILDLSYKLHSTAFVYFSKGLQVLFPPFEAMNFRDFIGSFEKFSFNFYIANAWYAILYTAVILILSVIIFNRKKFEN